MWRTRSIQALLSAPNPDDPLAENVARHWKDNEAEAVATGALPVASSAGAVVKSACGAPRGCQCLRACCLAASAAQQGAAARPGAAFFFFLG